MNILRPSPRGPITISQSMDARKLLQKFKMWDCNPVKIPLEPNAPSALRKFDHGIDEPADRTLYRQIVSFMIPLTFYTCPNVIFLVSKLGKFNSHPTITYFYIAKHVLYYVKGILDYTIT